MKYVFVFDLPDELFRCSIGPFLNLRSVARLDTATSARPFRTNLLKKFHHLFVSDLDKYGVRLDDKKLIWLRKRRLLAKSLNVGPELTEQGVRQCYPAFLRSVERVWYIGVKQPNGTAVVTFLTQCQNLKSLQITGVDSDFLGVIAREVALHCPHLQQLDLIKGTIRSADAIIIAQHARNQRILRLKRCSGITDEVIFAFAQNCAFLQEVEITCNQSTTSEAIEALAMGCTGLKTLAVDDCHQLKDEAVVTIAQRHGATLVTLDFHDSRLLTDVAGNAIAAHCPHLTKLDVGGNSGITDASMVQVARNCHSLTTLILFNSNVTDQTLIALAQNCHRLQALILLGVYGISGLGVLALQHGCPNLCDLRLDVQFMGHVMDVPLVPYKPPSTEPMYYMMNTPPPMHYTLMLPSPEVVTALLATLPPLPPQTHRPRLGAMNPYDPFPMFSAPPPPASRPLSLRDSGWGSHPPPIPYSPPVPPMAMMPAPPPGAGNPYNPFPMIGAPPPPTTRLPRLQDSGWGSHPPPIPYTPPMAMMPPPAPGAYSDPFAGLFAAENTPLPARSGQNPFNRQV